MIERFCGSLKWLSFELFQGLPLTHSVFTNHWYLSKKDNPSPLEALKLDPACIIKQVHGSCVIEANPLQIQEADGQVTDRKGLGLMIFHADCQPAIFYDPIEHVLATVHCGWRGNVHNIYQKTVETLKNRYSSKAENLLVGIGPSLGPEASQFLNYEKELPSSFYPFQVKPFYFDLWAISRSQLESCGILPHHIEIAGICTYSNPHDWFSYRRDGIVGRNVATIAALK